MSTGFQLRSYVQNYVCNRETVTLQDLSGSPQGTVPDSKRLGGTAEEKLPSHGQYLAYNVTWRLPANNVTVPIVPGFKIVDAGSKTYVVLRVDSPSTYLAPWRCLCLSLGVLGHTVQYSQVSCAGSDTDGSRTVTYTNIGTPVAAAIEPMTAELADMFGTKGFEDLFMVYMASDPSGTGPSVIGAGDLFTDETGVKYEIIESSERLRLDFVSAYRCVKKL